MSLLHELRSLRVLMLAIANIGTWTCFVLWLIHHFQVFVTR